MKWIYGEFDKLCIISLGGSIGVQRSSTQAPIGSAGRGTMERLITISRPPKCLLLETTRSNN